MKIHSLRRLVQGCLAKAPTLYRGLLIAMNRGSSEKRRYLQLIRKGDVVIDVGANLGYFTLLFSDLVGTKGAVLAFEPVPTTRKLLQENIQANALYSNVVVNSVACSDTVGTAEIAVPDDDFGQASMRSHRMGSWASVLSLKSFSVETIKLDDYAAERRLSSVHFIKCDAEGAELLVLRGAAALLRQFHPLLSLEVAEYWTVDFGYSAANLADFLIACGYVEFLVGEDLVDVESFRGCLAERARGESQQVICAGANHAGRLQALISGV
jgi:FkbM family methyltransferase